jgi:hypothetical protein
MTSHVSQAMPDHSLKHSRRQALPILTSGAQSRNFLPKTGPKRGRDKDDTLTQPKNKKLRDKAGYKHTRPIISAWLNLPLYIIETVNSCIRQRLHEFNTDNVLSLNICDMLRALEGALSALKGSLERAQGLPE